MSDGRPQAGRPVVLSPGCAGHFSTTVTTDASIQLIEPQFSGFCDALEISFELSSEQPIADPHAVLIIGVRAPDEPNVVKRTTRVFRLPGLEGKPRKARLLVTGLPSGYAPEFQRIHVFAGAEEIPTNLSARRISVSRSDAYQVLISQHFSTHPTDSMPPTPARVLNRAVLGDRLSAEHLVTIVEIDVSAAGLATKAAATYDPSGALDALTPEVLRSMLFMPALENGKPVAGTFIGRLREIL